MNCPHKYDNTNLSVFTYICAYVCFRECVNVCTCKTTPHSMCAPYQLIPLISQQCVPVLQLPDDQVQLRYLQLEPPHIALLNLLGERGGGGRHKLRKGGHACRWWRWMGGEGGGNEMGDELAFCCAKVLYTIPGWVLHMHVCTVCMHICHTGRVPEISLLSMNIFVVFVVMHMHVCTQNVCHQRRFTLESDGYIGPVLDFIRN